MGPRLQEGRRTL